MSWMSLRICSRWPSSCSLSCACSSSALRRCSSLAPCSCTSFIAFACAATTCASDSARSRTRCRTWEDLAVSSRTSISARARSLATPRIFRSRSCSCALLPLVICSASCRAFSNSAFCSGVNGSCFCDFAARSCCSSSRRLCSARRVLAWLSSWDLLRASRSACDPRSCCRDCRTSRRLRTWTLSGLTFSSLARASCQAFSTCVVAR
mmetsp:Transcript_34645/g.102944  ORF Transcript_34645/g.102944 Transcript_34645/m.102944 type:complete len:207 (-) Transcript_34645:826-1446(-)